MFNFFKKKQKKMNPTEVICYPQKYRLRIYLNGNATPLEYLQIGEKAIKTAYNFVKWASKKKEGIWHGDEQTSKTIIIRRSCISCVRLEKE